MQWQAVRGGNLVPAPAGMAAPCLPLDLDNSIVKLLRECCHISTKGHLVHTNTSLGDLITIYSDLAFPHLLIKTLTLAHNMVPVQGQVGQVEGDTFQPQHQPEDTQTQPGTAARLSCPTMSRG